MFQTLQKWLKDFGLFLVTHFRMVFIELNEARNGLPISHQVRDFVSVLRSCGVFAVLNFLALLVFTFLPQGKDVLLMVVEDIGVKPHRFGNLICLLIGVFIWSIVSEFGSRYAIYVTDNSGRSLSDERVRWRKAVQDAIAQIFLILPYVILLLGFVINYLGDSTLKPDQKYWGFGVPAFCLLLLVNLVARAYFPAVSKSKRNPQDDYAFDAKAGAYMTIKPSGIMSFMRLSKDEKIWSDKLIGIYNDYVFQLHKPSNFTKGINKNLELFTDQFRILSPQQQSDFLKDPRNMPAETRVPDEFEADPAGVLADNRDETMFRWIYRIPLRFYKNLHLQLKIISIVSGVIFVVVCFLPIRFYEAVGAPGLVTLAFACWIGIYVGLLYIDYGLFRGKRSVSVRLVLIALLIFSSFMNNDHPVRYDIEGIKDERPWLSNHFDSWFEQYKTVGDHRYFFSWIKDSALAFDAEGAKALRALMVTDSVRFGDSLRREYGVEGITAIKEGKLYKMRLPGYPVMFVCAEGGALRTGAFTAQMLSFLQDKLAHAQDSFYASIAHDTTRDKTPFIQPLEPHIFDFKRAIYAYSGVSGGSLGIGWFNAMAHLTPDSLHRVDSLAGMTDIFFKQDYLSPVLGKMFYGDLLNLFIPFAVPSFDRATALEKGWEKGFGKTITKDADNIFSDDFLRCYQNKEIYPAMFINTTEVESGLQCWLSNVRPDSCIILSEKRDLLHHKIRGGLRYSTVVNFSTRFPLFSPAANVKQDDETKYHYLDGGYIENTGTGTMLEILKALKRNSAGFKNKEAIPFVFVLNFSDEKESDNTQINFGNEISEILQGIYNSRAGRSAMAMTELKRYVTDSLRGKVIQLSLGKTGSEVPMNWTLSENSLFNLKEDIREKWERRQFNDLNKLYILSPECKLILGPGH